MCVICYVETINPYKDIFQLSVPMIRQSFHCESQHITHADSRLIGGEFAEDMVSVGWTDPNLREGCKFLEHLIQQSLHLQKKYHGQFAGFKRGSS